LLFQTCRKADLDAVRRQLGTFESRVGTFNQELSGLKNLIDRQTADIQTLSGELRNRPPIDAVVGPIRGGLGIIRLNNRD